MFCSKCGNDVLDTSLFCSNCGSKIEIEDEYDRLRREVLENEPKPLYKTKFYWLLLFGLIGIFVYLNNKNSSENSLHTEDNSNCVGNEKCIDKIRLNYTSSGKQILNESYLGNGIFKITVLDPSRGVTFNSDVTTDCNCKLKDIKITDVQ